MGSWLACVLSRGLGAGPARKAESPAGSWLRGAHRPASSDPGQGGPRLQVDATAQGSGGQEREAALTRMKKERDPHSDCPDGGYWLVDPGTT